MTGCPNHTSLEAEQLLQPATQPPVEQWPTEAPEVSNTRENRSLEGHDETKQATSDDKDKGTNLTKEKIKVGRDDEEEYVLDGDIIKEIDVGKHDNAPEDNDK
jgi:hypothetical protein